VTAADVIIIDSGGANLASLVFALDRLGAASRVSSNAAEIAAAPRVLLPGVGAARDAMDRLAGLGLVDCIRSLTQPLLGICLGMQLLFEHSEEGDTPCLGVLPGRVQRLQSAPGRPVPHMGWNTFSALGAGDPLLAGLGGGDYCYFVHSYAAPVGDCTSASSDYGVPFSAVVRRANFHGVQFHPERSAASGARLLQNFLGP
jgi:glutamine amidotransferase